MYSRLVRKVSRLANPLVFVAVIFSVAAIFSVGHLNAAEKVKHQITGMFSHDRERDLREAVLQMPDIRLISIDFPNAEATFEYDSEKVFPNANSAQVVERFNNLLKNASNHTFGVKPVSTIGKDKLEFVEIPVGGIDCKACCLGAYEAVFRIDGVERATASFRDGLVTAWIDPQKTDSTKLAEALKARGVEIVKPSDEQKD